jgi:hypothetical protein
MNLEQQGRLHLAKNLVPASPAVIAAAKYKNHNEDNDEKCGVVHVALL